LSGIASLIWLLVSLALLIPITRAFGGLIQGLVLLLTENATATVYAHFCLLLPGTILHELSHWLAAKLLGVRTGGLSIAPKAQRGGRVQFGAVKMQKTGPVRESLIGVAPLLVGSALVVWLARWRFGLDPAMMMTPDSIVAHLVAALDAPDAWVWVYVIMAISNAMIPSPSDTRAWPRMGLYLAILLAFLWVSDLLSRVPEGAVDLGLAIAQGLAFSFSLTILVDLVVGAALFLAQLLTARLTGKHLVSR